jgi:hypothetical protein
MDFLSMHPFFIVDINYYYFDDGKWIPILLLMVRRWSIRNECASFLSKKNPNNNNNNNKKKKQKTNKQTKQKHENKNL